MPKPPRKLPPAAARAAPDASTTAAAADSAPFRWPAWLPGLLIFCATLVAYLPALSAGFIWDDAAHVTAPGLRSLDGLRRIWFEVGATEQYYPVLHSAFWVQHLFWSDSPAGYHVVNLLLHAGCALLFATVLRRLAVPGAWLAAVLFALHPVCVESVAWVSELKNTLSTACYLGAALFYLDYDERRAPRAYLLASGLFVLALLSKSVTASLPAALLVIFWWQGGRLDLRRDVRPLVPWFVAGAAMGLFTAWVEHRFIGARGADFDLGLIERGLLAGRVGWFYLGKLVWPSDLIFIYPRWSVDATAAWQWLFPLTAVAALAVLWRLRKKSRAPLAVALLFGGTLFPVLGFFNVYPFRFSFVADHWQYLACLAPLALVSAYLATWWARDSTACLTVTIIVGVVLVVFSALTWRQCGLYRDMESFYRLTLDRNPGCWMAHNNLGNMLAETGRLAEALPHYEAAVRLKPTDSEAQNNFGSGLGRAGHPAEAIVHYEAALRLRPDYSGAAYNLALALRELGRLNEAVVRLADCLRLRPNYADAWNSLGLCLADLGQTDDAIVRFEHAVQLDPRHFEALNNLGALFLKLNRPAEAISRLTLAIAVHPDSLETRTNLGVALGQAGRLDEAIAEFRRTVALHPDATGAHANLGICLLKTGHANEAAAEFEQVVRLRPDDSGAHYRLATILQEIGRTAEAAREFQRANQLQSAAPAPGR